MRFIDEFCQMSQKIKTVIGNVLITDYCLYASILLICREEIINLINITRFIRARNTLAICAWLFIGTAKKCCQILIDQEAQKDLLKNYNFVTCLLEISGTPFYETFLRQVNNLSKIFTLLKYFKRINYMSCLSRSIRTKLFLALAFEKNSKTESVLECDF